MATFYYQAKDKSGTKVSGIIDAATPEAVAELLQSRKLAVLDVTQKPRNSYVNLVNLFLLRRVSVKELVIFFRQLSVMLDANMPIVKALRILVRQTQNEYFRNIIISLADEVDGGSTLSLAMEFHHDIFSKFYVNIIRSGETSGRLSEVMKYLADQKEKDYDLESKVKGAMIYPAFIVAVLVVVGFIVIAFVIPSISAILLESGATLPFITRVLIGLANFLRSFWWLIILAVIIIGTGWYFWIKTPVGKSFFDELKLRIPVFGSIFQNIYIVRICLSFATLIKGGVPIATALVVVRDVVDNAVYEKVLSDASRSVDEGNQISESLSLNSYIPLIMAQMISIGEESGKLEEVLERTAEFYTREIDNATRNLSTLIEPLIMIVLGVAVGLFVAAVILPMWQLSASI